MASQFQRCLAVRALKRGGVIAYPTEGVWGLGCDPFNAVAVARLLQIKQRPAAKGLILVAANMLQIEHALYAINTAQRKRLELAWPGAHTFVVPDPQQVLPGWLRGEHSSIAVRVSAHLEVQKLCELFGGPIVSTSANPSTLPAAHCLLKVRQYFKDELDYILPGKLGDAKLATSIQDLISGRLLRA